MQARQTKTLNTEHEFMRPRVEEICETYFKLHGNSPLEEDIIPDIGSDEEDDDEVEDDATAPAPVPAPAPAPAPASAAPA